MGKETEQVVRTEMDRMLQMLAATRIMVMETATTTMATIKMEITNKMEAMGMLMEIYREELETLSLIPLHLIAVLAGVIRSIRTRTEAMCAIMS